MHWKTPDVQSLTSPMQQQLANPTPHLSQHLSFLQAHPQASYPEQLQQMESQFQQQM